MCRDGIVQWVDRLAGGAAKAVSTTAEVADAKKRKLLMLGYFDKFDGEAHEAFNKRELGFRCC